MIKNTAVALLFSLGLMGSANACEIQNYHLVFAINNADNGIAGYSEASALACSGGLSELEVIQYRKQVADHHRKKNPRISDDQVVLLTYQAYRTNETLKRDPDRIPNLTPSLKFL